MGVFVIAEAGVNHNGDINLAKKLIDMAIRCGADAIKFQTFKAEECVNQSTDKVGYQKENDHREETQYEMLKRLELSYAEFKELKEYADNKGMMFLSTPFGNAALEFLIELGIPLVKLSSTEVTNHPYLRKVARYHKPIILSTGMSYLEEVQQALQVIKSEGNEQVTLLHCTTNYPAKVEEVNIKAMDTMAQQLNVGVGYSDHTEGCESAIAAVVLGAKVIEKHITLDKEMEGPDHRASMVEKEFKNYVKGIRMAESLLGDGVKQPTQDEQVMRNVVRRSIVAKSSLKKGTILTEESFEYKRPATGLGPQYVQQLIGQELIRDIRQDEMILLSDIKGR